MSRPSGDSEARLVSAGKAILVEQGLGSLSVRAVAARAGVNLGLVSYHFGGKDAFVKRVIQEIYEDFFRDFSLEVEGEADSLRALRVGLLNLARFSRDKRTFIRGLARDLMAGVPQARTFVQTNAPRHVRVLVGLVRRCMVEGRLTRRPLLQVIPMLMGGLMAPNVVVPTILEMAPKLPFSITRRIVEKEILSDAALETRVDLLLKALKP